MLKLLAIGDSHIPRRAKRIPDEIIENLKPSTIISSPQDGDVFYENEIIQFDGTKSSDPDDEILNFIWFLNDENINTQIEVEKNLDKGDYTIVLKVSDEFGDFDLDEVRFSVLSIESDITFDENDIIIDGKPKVNEEINIIVKFKNFYRDI